MEPAKLFYIRRELLKNQCFHVLPAPLHTRRRGRYKVGKKWSVCAKVVRHPNVNEDEEVMEAVAVNKQQVQGAFVSGACRVEMVHTCFTSEAMLSKHDLRPQGQQKM